MLTFKEYTLNEQRVYNSIQDLVLLSSLTPNMLSESVLDTQLKKLGLHVQKSKGIIHHLKNAGVGIANMFVAALRGDGEKVKEIVKSIKKEDVIDFLLKLDMASIHLVTGPIHFIDAMTGLHLWASIKEKIDDSSIVDSIKSALEVIKRNISKIKTKNTNMMKKFITNIEKELNKT